MGRGPRPLPKPLPGAVRASLGRPACLGRVLSRPLPPPRAKCGPWTGPAPAAARRPVAGPLCRVSCRRRPRRGGEALALPSARRGGSGRRLGVVPVLLSLLARHHGRNARRFGPGALPGKASTRLPGGPSGGASLPVRAWSEAVGTADRPRGVAGATNQGDPT